MTEEKSNGTATEVPKKEPRPEKVAIVNEARQLFADSSSIAFTKYRGLDVNEMAELRSSLAEAGGKYKVYKNSFTRLAVADVAKEWDLEEIKGFLSGPTGVAFANEETDSALFAKILVTYRKEHEDFVIKGAFFDGQMMEMETVEALAKLPTREVMLAQMAGLLQAPMSKFAALLAASNQKFVGLLKALIDDKGGEEVPAEEKSAEEAPAEDKEEPPAESEPKEEAPAEEKSEETAEDKEEEAPAEEADSVKDEAAEPAAEEAPAEDKEEAPPEEKSAEEPKDASDTPQEEEPPEEEPQEEKQD